jgi:hypothetical protein
VAVELADFRARATTERDLSTSALREITHLVFNEFVTIITA